MTLSYCRIPFPPQLLFNLSLWLIEIEINMLDEKLIKFLALQRIHQLFPSRVQASPGSVGAHPLASGGHHTEGAHAHATPLGPPSACEQPSPLHGESQSSMQAFTGLNKIPVFFSQKRKGDGDHHFQIRLGRVLLLIPVRHKAARSAFGCM